MTETSSPTHSSILPTVDSLNYSVNDRKRTRGVQSSIATAMALKEKRSTLMEAKDIRKAKQQQLQTEIQEHHNRQKTQNGYHFSTKNENTSFHINSELSNDETPPKKIRLKVENEPQSSRNTVTRRSSTDSNTPNMLTEIKSELMKVENDGDIKCDGIGSWSNTNVLLNQIDDNAEKDVRTTIELVAENEVEHTVGFSVHEEDLVTECMSQSYESFPNVEDLVSGLASSATPSNIILVGNSKTVGCNNSQTGNQSPVSSQTCSSIAS